MREKRYLYTFIATLVILFFGGNTVYAESNDSFNREGEIRYQRVSEEEFDRLSKDSNVASGQKALVKEMQKHALKRETSFSISYRGNAQSIPKDMIHKIGEIDDKTTSDDSDFLSGGILRYGWTGYYTGVNRMVLKCNYVYTENKNQVKKVNTQSNKILKKLKVSGMSDVAKVKAIHDYVVKLVKYDHSLRDHSAYGGLAASKHSTVCQGYALIMYKLLTDAKVPVHYVTGNAGGPHAWNIVKINKKWYYLDATWDDPSNVLSYNYFLIGSKKMNKDHSLDKYYKDKYKISTTDLDWKKAIKNSKKKADKKVKTDQTKKQKEKSKKAKKRKDAAKKLDTPIDDMIEKEKKEDPDDYKLDMYDLGKKIFENIIEDMSDEAFEKYEDNNIPVKAEYTAGTMGLIKKKIIDPLLKYTTSEKFTEDVDKEMYSDFDKDELSKIPEKDKESLWKSYAYSVFNEKLHELSEKHTKSIVSTMVKKLDSMAK